MSAAQLLSDAINSGYVTANDIAGIDRVREELERAFSLRLQPLRWRQFYFERGMACHRRNEKFGAEVLAAVVMAAAPDISYDRFIEIRDELVRREKLIASGVARG